MNDLENIKLSDSDNKALESSTNLDCCKNEIKQYCKEINKQDERVVSQIYVNSESQVMEAELDPITDQRVKDLETDRKLREKFGDKAYNVVRKTLYGWAFLLGTYAFFRFFFNKCLFSDNVLIAITSAVTLNTFAAFLGVIRGLFPSNKPSERKIKNSD